MAITRIDTIEKNRKEDRARMRKTTFREQPLHNLDIGMREISSIQRGHISKQKAPRPYTIGELFEVIETDEMEVKDHVGLRGKFTRFARRFNMLGGCGKLTSIRLADAISDLYVTHSKANSTPTQPPI